MPSSDNFLYIGLFIAGKLVGVPCGGGVGGKWTEADFHWQETHSLVGPFMGCRKSGMHLREYSLLPTSFVAMYMMCVGGK